MKGTNKKKVSTQEESSSQRVIDKKWFPVVFFLLAFLVYFNTIFFGYSGDDSIVTYNNSFVQQGVSSFSGIIKNGMLKGLNGSNIAEYRPVTILSFAMEKSMFGNSPKVNHFFNVFLYALLCALLFIFMRKILKQYPLVVAALITTLFVLHPIHTEVVANIKSRDEILCMLFGLLSLNYIFEYQQSSQNRFLIYSYITFFLCLLSKENGYAYIGLIPLVLYFFSDSTFKRVVLLTLPFFAIAGLSILIRMNVLDSFFLTGKLTMMENSLLAATTSGDMLATNFTMLFHQLWLLFFPLTLSWDYSFNEFPVVGWNDLKAVLSLLIHLGLLSIAILGLKKKNIFSFIILFYFISSFITSNLVIKIGSSFGERFLFTPSLAFCMGLLFLLAKLFSVDPEKKELPGSSPIFKILAVVFLLYSLKTISRNRDWKDSESLFASGVETSPNSIRTHNLYANSLRQKAASIPDMEQKRELLKTAIDEFQKGLAIYPNSGTYYELGLIYYSLGDTGSTAEMFKRALQLQPDFVQALNNYGLILFNKKEYVNALGNFKRAVEKDPGHVRALAGVAACYQKLNDYGNAIVYYERAIQLSPANANFSSNLSALYSHMGDTAKANFYSRLTQSH